MLLSASLSRKTNNTGDGVVIESHGPQKILLWRDYKILWKLRRGSRSLRLKIYPDLSIHLSSGLRPNYGEIAHFLQTNEVWLKNSLNQHWQQLLELKKQGLLPQPWPGGWVPFMGHAMRLRLCQSVQQEGVDWAQKQLNLFAEATNCRDRLLAFYRQQAAVYLPEIQAEVSQRMQLFPRQVQVRAVQSKWGYCSSRGDITYNWRLLAAPYRWIEYVVIHETAHLKHMDHSAAFWALVKAHSPDFARYSEGLKKQQNIFEFLNEKSNLYGRAFHLNLFDSCLFDSENQQGRPIFKQSR